MTPFLFFLLVVAAVVFPAGLAYLVLDVLWATEGDA